MKIGRSLVANIRCDIEATNFCAFLPKKMSVRMPDREYIETFLQLFESFVIRGFDPYFSPDMLFYRRDDGRELGNVQGLHASE